MPFEPDLEQLVLFARHRLEEPTAMRISAHLEAGCPNCERDLAWIHAVHSALDDDPSRVPPESLEHVSERVFADIQRQKRERNPRARHAVMTFDTAWVPLSPGIRAPASGQRRLVCRAEPFNIDLEVSRIRRGTYDIMGQIIPAAQVPAGSRVIVHRRPVIVVPIEERGFFAIEGIPRGVVDVSFELPPSTVKLSRVVIQ